MVLWVWAASASKNFRIPCLAGRPNGWTVLWLCHRHCKSYLPGTIWSFWWSTKEEDNWGQSWLRDEHWRGLRVWYPPYNPSHPPSQLCTSNPPFGKGWKIVICSSLNSPPPPLPLLPISTFLAFHPACPARQLHPFHFMNIFLIWGFT